MDCLIGKVEVVEEDLHLVLLNGGSASYQHIYREAQSVYWDNEKNSFYATLRTRLSTSELFVHICKIVEMSIGLHLQLSDTVV